LDRYNANLGKYDAAVTEYSKRVEVFNAKCGGTLPPDQYRACLGEKGELAGRKIELDSEKASLEKERQTIEAELKARNDRLSAIAKEMTANLQAWEKAQKDYQAVFARIDVIKKRLVEHCAAGEAARDPFAVRLCVGLGWDGEKKDFTALTDLPPPLQ
jgi:predicted  nucleic acid-binding Zn-ribbon protein